MLLWAGERKGPAGSDAEGKTDEGRVRCGNFDARPSRIQPTLGRSFDLRLARSVNQTSLRMTAAGAFFGRLGGDGRGICGDGSICC